LLDSLLQEVVYNENVGRRGGESGGEPDYQPRGRDRGASHARRAEAARNEEAGPGAEALYVPC